MVLTCHLTELRFGVVLASGHKLYSAHLDRVVAIVLEKGDIGAIRGGGLVHHNGFFHCYPLFFAEELFVVDQVFDGVHHE